MEYLEHFQVLDPYVIRGPGLKSPNQAIRFSDVADIATVWKGEFGSFMQRVPYYHALVVDPWGHVWLQEYEPPWGPGPRWYVLSQAGEQLADIVMPKELTVHGISKDDILAGTVGEYDEERIEVLPWITKPSRAASPLPQCEAA